MAQIVNKFLAQAPTLTLKGNNSGITANVSDLTVAQVQSMLSIPTSSSPLAIGSGGTGQTSAASAYNALSPMSTTGDIEYEVSAGVAGRLAIGTTNQVLTVVGGVPAWSSVAASANESLSNLTSPTAINQSLLPGTTATFNLGSSSAEWSTIYALATQVFYSSGSPQYIITGTNNLPSGDGIALEVLSGSTSSVYEPMGFVSSSDSTANSNQTANIYIETGNKTAGTGNSGNIKLYLGTSSGGTRGKLQIQDGSQGTSGYIWTSTDTSGSGHWALNPGANAITSLTGDVTGTGPGATATTLATVNSNVGTFGSSTSIPSFTVNAKGLITAASSNVVIAPAGTLSGTTLNSTVVSSSLTSLGAQSQALNMNSNQINNLASPSISTDAANKGYVDAAISGLTWQGPAQAYAASNVPLTGSTPLVIDGYTVLNGNLVLLGNQTTASQNGEYSVAITGGSYVLTANGLPTAVGDAWLVTHGTVYANSAFTATAVVPAAEFTEFAGPNSYIFNSPLSLSGNTVSLSLNAAGAIVNSSGLLVQTDGSTTKINGSNQIEAQSAFQENLTLSSGDITNQYKDLSHVASGTSSSVNSIQLSVYGGPEQLQGTDYTVSLTGGTGGVTRITFAGALATGGSSALVSGDILMVSYSYLA